MLYEIPERQVETIEKIKGIDVKKLEINKINDLEETKGFATRFKTVKDKVLSIVRNDEYARKDYFYLCLLFWIKTGAIKLIVPLDKFFYITKPESISRAYRSLVSDAKKGNPQLRFLLKDEETINNRQEIAEEIREYFGAEKIKSRARLIK